jgi:hypothetical protein
MKKAGFEVTSTMVEVDGGKGEKDYTELKGTK